MPDVSRRTVMTTALGALGTLSSVAASAVDLFLSPIGPRGMTRTMQAVVNRTA